MSESTGEQTPADEVAYLNDRTLAGEGEGNSTASSPVGVHHRVGRSRGAARAARRPIITGHAAGTGRRKEAIARVRIVPGAGQWKINGRTLDGYFPNKVHQQIVSEPFVTLGAEDKFDVIALIGGGGVTGQAGALRLGRRSRADPRRPGEPPVAEEGRLPHQGRPGEGTEEVRPQEGPQGSSVLQALAVGWHPCKPTWAESSVLTVFEESLGEI